MSRNFEAEKEEIMIQKTSYEICDNDCKIDPMSCSFRYGNWRACRTLAGKLQKVFDDRTGITDKV
jgi:hypothetical protein